MDYSKIADFLIVAIFLVGYLVTDFKEARIDPRGFIGFDKLLSKFKFYKLSMSVWVFGLWSSKLEYLAFKQVKIPSAPIPVEKLSELNATYMAIAILGILIIGIAVIYTLILILYLFLDIMFQSIKLYSLYRNRKDFLKERSRGINFLKYSLNFYSKKSSNTK